MKTKTTILPNGLTVILIDTGSFPTFTAQILVRVGSRYETEKTNGIAHFFEHMSLKGSRSYPTSFDVSSRIEGVGGIFNAYTSKDHTGYWIKAPVAHFHDLFDVLSDGVLNPNLDPKEIESEKGVIVEEIKMYEDIPSHKVSELFDAVIFAGNPLSYDIAGTVDTVTSFNRESFLEYISTFYHPQNTVIVLAGGLTQGGMQLETYIDQITKKFTGWSKKTPNTFQQFSHSQNAALKHVHFKKTEQSHFCLGYRTFAHTDPRRYALNILGVIMGGGMSSRLFMEVREKRGLCYYIGTGREYYSDTGYLVTQVGVSTEPQKLNEALKVIKEEQQKLAGGCIDNAELSRAKELLKGRLILALEESHKVASMQGTRFLLEGSMIAIEELINKIDSVEKEDVTQVAQTIFDESQSTLAVVGPVTDEQVIHGT